MNFLQVKYLHPVFPRKIFDLDCRHNSLRCLETPFNFDFAMPLKDVFEDFKKSKATLQKIHNDTIEYFKEIVQNLSDPRAADIAVELTHARCPPSPPPNREATASGIHFNLPQGTEATVAIGDVHYNSTQTVAVGEIQCEFDFSLAELLYTANEKREVETLFSEEPALIFVGQTNCGKSSIINELLGCKALPTSDQPSTARIVRVSYAEKPFCRLVAKDGRILQDIELKGRNKIPRKKIELNQKDRENAAKVEATVETGLNIEFLKCGVSVIDSPGRNENEALDNLVKEKLENPLAFVIYVVDGHNLFTKQDREVLSDMTSRRPDLQIFFVVSKLEPEDRTESSDEDEESGQNASARLAQEAKVQARKKKRVYERLVKHGYFSAESGQAMDENERFHGLSAWRIQRYHEMKKKNPDAPDGEFTVYIEAFERFQNSLTKFAEESLRQRVEKVCEVLIRVLSRCLDFFIRKANVLKKGQQLMMKTLDTLLQQEMEVHNNIIGSLEVKSTEIKELLFEAFKGAHDGILLEAAEFEYALTEFSIPRDGFVSEKAAVAHCKDQLQRMVVNKLQGEVKERLTMMFRSRDVFVAEMKERIEQIEEETAVGGDSSSAALALGRSLLSSYEAQISFGRRDGVMFRVIKSFATWIYDFLCDPFDTIIKTVKGRVQVGSPKWKKDVASSVLTKVDPTKMAEEIISSLKEHFTSCHDEFVAEVSKVQGLFHRGETIKDEQRQKILEFAPNLALLEMLAYGVMDKFKFGLPSKGKLIGTGAQGSVFACDNIKTPEGKPCVVKVVSVAKEEVLKDLTLELHNTRSLRHPNILPILCSIVEANPTRSLSVSLVSERMRCDLQEGLPAISSLRKRLEILLDVAKALQYLHAEELIHRDVKLQNVLLDEHNRAKLTDLGLCKPEGLASNSLVGTPINMAPEMIKQQYDNTIDVYAFGMLVWRVCEGKGNQPKNINKHFLPLVMLMLNALENKTPERLDSFPQSCWELMERCWAQDPEKRPSMDTVVNDLEKILRDEHHE